MSQSHSCGHGDYLTGMPPTHKEVASNPVLTAHFHEASFYASRI